MCGLGMLVFTGGTLAIRKRLQVRRGRSPQALPRRFVLAGIGVALAISVVLVVLVHGNGSASPGATAPSTVEAPGAYPADSQAAFLAGCEHVESTAANCGCLLDYTETHVSYSTYQSAGEEIQRGSTSRPAWMTAASGACLKQ
jgi:hypothetical protein